MLELKSKNNNLNFKTFILLVALFTFSILVFSFNEVKAQSSTTYKLKSYGFGAGGGTNLDSSGGNYSLEGILGEISGQQSSTTYKLNSGLIFVQNANVPPAPTFVNSSNWYNKLKITINKDAGDPTDAKYAIAISTDDFVTTRWVQNDNTVGNTLGAEDFQLYADWGGASGEFIIGLTQGTTYKVKVKSTQGKYTESALGPEASAATSNVSLTFDLDVSSSDSETAAPYSVSLGNLTAGSVTTATNKVWVDFATNADYGGYIYISGLNTGLRSTNVNYTINSATADLASASEGYGIQSATDSESSGGPMAPISPYNGSSQNVGIIDTSVRELYSSSAAPVTGGRTSFFMKAKAKTTTPAASDFTDTLTIVASATF